jgi:hypothetical protein
VHSIREHSVDLEPPGRLRTGMHGDEFVWRSVLIRIAAKKAPRVGWERFDYRQR